MKKQVSAHVLYAQFWAYLPLPDLQKTITKTAVRLN